MAFLDKINQVAKNIGDKTNDAIENTKLTQKINSEKGAAGEEFKKIGEYYYNVFLSGGEVAPEVYEFCQSAKAHLDAAAAAQAEIERNKAEGPQNMQAAPTQPVQGGGFCLNCGTPLTPGTKFCQGCGTKIE